MNKKQLGWLLHRQSFIPHPHFNIIWFYCWEGTDYNVLHKMLQAADAGLMGMLLLGAVHYRLTPHGMLTTSKSLSGWLTPWTHLCHCPLAQSTPIWLIITTILLQLYSHLSILIRQLPDQIIMHLVLCHQMWIDSHKAQNNPKVL